MAQNRSARDYAKRERDTYCRNRKAQGANVRRFVLRNQLRPYAGLGIPDGRIRNVYYVDVQAQPYALQVGAL